jgi:hypothetical protein
MPWRVALEHLCAISDAFRAHADFLVIYVSEAHAKDE